MTSRTRRLKIPETLTFTTIGVITVTAYACGTSGSGTATSSSSASSSTGMGGDSSSSHSASSSSGSSTCTPDGGMCVAPDGGDQQTIYSCLDVGVPDAGCPTGFVCMSSDCPLNCEPLLYVYCPSDAGCAPTGEVYGCTKGPDAGAGTMCPSDYRCSADDCPAGCIGEPLV